MSAAGFAIPLHGVGASLSSGRARWMVLGFVGFLCATLWAFTRIPMAGALHGWASTTCVRLEMAPTDWPCRVTMGRSLAIYLTASALVSLGVLLPTLVLAVRGRRLLAFVPMLAPLAIMLLGHAATWAWSGHWVPLKHTTTPQLFLGPWAYWASGGEAGSVWRPDHPAAIGTDLVLLGLPVLVLIALKQSRRVPRAGFTLRSAFLALGLAAGASLIVEWATHAVAGGAVYLEGGWFLQGLAIVSFGLLLPLGPGRPLWAIPLVACLLSLGAPAAIAGHIYDHGMTTFTFFRSALPLALMGFAGAGVTAFVARQRGLGADGGTRPTDRVRPVAVGYGVALATVAIGTVMAALDPLPYMISTPLPTYLGARERVTDLRARMTLDEALDVASRYRATGGSFEGFDAHAGRASEPSLLWVDGLPSPETSFGPELEVRVIGSSADAVELVLVGDVTTYCVRTTERGSTYGIAREGRPRERARTALERCGALPWAADLLRPFPIGTLCDDATEVVLCRATQQRLRSILASPTGIA